MKEDNRSPLAFFRDQWFEGEGKQLLESSILKSISDQKYLKNRLEVAYLAGARQFGGGCSGLIYREIDQEVFKSNEKFGEQNWPVLNQNYLESDPGQVTDHYLIEKQDYYKEIVGYGMSQGTCTWMDIILEEVSEACAEIKDAPALRKELIQVACVVVKAIESLDRNGK